MEGYVTNGASSLCCFTCHGCSQWNQEDSGMFGSICATVSVWPDIFFFYQFGLNICLPLISAVEGMEWGACRLEAYLFTLRVSSSVPQHPTTSTPSFLSRIFHIFVFAVVLGTGCRLGTREPPVAFLNLTLDKFFPTAHILSHSPGVFLQPQTKHYDSVSTHVPKSDIICIFLWVPQFSRRFTVEWSYLLSANPFH